MRTVPNCASRDGVQRKSGQTTTRQTGACGRCDTRDSRSEGLCWSRRVEGNVHLGPKKTLLLEAKGWETGGDMASAIRVLRMVNSVTSEDIMARLEHQESLSSFEI